MKKIFLTLIFFFGSINVLSAEINRITAGNKEAKITIIAYESLTCSHCADFHRDISVSYTHLTLPTIFRV